MEIDIETGDGIIEGFKVDGELIDGLYSTINIKKVKSNRKIFGIQIEAPRAGTISHNFSNRNNPCLPTMKVDDENAVQYLVGSDMAPSELDDVPENEMPSDLRNKIVEAHSLAKLKFK